MKRITAIIVLFLVLGTTEGKAQRVSVRIGFPIGMRVNAPGPSPFYGAVWVGPEWEWRGRNYVCVPGYWSKPRYSRAVWIPGHWQYSRRGYRWEPGRWK